jgi:predicted nucleic-acid-binding Zn-ribbon protein
MKLIATHTTHSSEGLRTPSTVCKLACSHTSTSAACLCPNAKDTRHVSFDTHTNTHTHKQDTLHMSVDTHTYMHTLMCSVPHTHTQCSKCGPKRVVRPSIECTRTQSCTHHVGLQRVIHTSYCTRCTHTHTSEQAFYSSPLSRVICTLSRVHLHMFRTTCAYTSVRPL